MRAANQFYKTIAWQNCQRAYKKYVGGLCERCLARGEYSPGEIVHHKIHLTPENYSNPEISLNYDNLELLCRKCHAEQHPEIYKWKSEQKQSNRRFTVDANGNVTATPGR